MTIHYVRPDGSYVGGYSEEDGDIPAATPSDREAAPDTVKSLICIDREYPEYADQIWQFPGWGPSQMKLSNVENIWREAEIQAIGNQLMAIEEAEAGSEDAHPLPGTRSQWLIYRTKVRAWKAGEEGFPDQSKRPVRPK
ncbi:hypothetical protein [Pseudomonas synxantha]|uniref:hypothetical protein n=1 Tax=Pseudomonas synxantha TaxID=47883 RepID=UPI0006147E76|nr:hypothetical protein [Pseudomonas synxantha]